MAFEVSEEAVAVMRQLAKQLPNTVEEIQKSNVEVLNCYESVRDTVGPHARKIEVIVRDIEKQIKKSLADIQTVSDRHGPECPIRYRDRFGLLHSSQPRNSCSCLSLHYCLKLPPHQKIPHIKQLFLLKNN